MASVTFTDGPTWPDPQRDHLSLVSRKVGPFLAVIPGPSGVDIAKRLTLTTQVTPTELSARCSTGGIHQQRAAKLTRKKIEDMIDRKPSPEELDQIVLNKTGNGYWRGNYRSH